MGAWSYEVMSNDDALDTIDIFVDSDNLAATLKNFLHENHYVHEFLLAVAIVDISLNGVDKDILGGFYQYEDWFKKLPENPMEELRADALHVIKFIQKVEDEENGWVEDCVEPRKELLKKIEMRLTKEN